MVSDRVGAHPPPLATSNAVTLGLPLAALWALYAAFAQIPEAGYLRLPVLFGLSSALLVWRLSSRRRRRRTTHKHGITVGVCCWGAAATFSALSNWNTAHVPLNYVSMFAASAAVYASLSGLTLTKADLEAAIVGLGAGAVGAVTLDWMRKGEFAGVVADERTVGFQLIVMPVLLTQVFDRSRSTAYRAVCGAALLTLAIELAVVPVTPACMAAFCLALLLVCLFAAGIRRLGSFAGAVALAALLLISLQPELRTVIAERSVNAAAAANAALGSVDWRTGTVQEEGLALARYWLLGNGPGAHASHGMATGLLGVFGFVLVAIGVWISLARAFVQGGDEPANQTRFVLAIGPAAFIAYAIAAGSASSAPNIDTWTVLSASMLALMPSFRPRTERAGAEDLAPTRPAPSQESMRPSHSFPSLA